MWGAGGGMESLRLTGSEHGVTHTFSVLRVWVQGLAFGVQGLGFSSSPVSKKGAGF